MATLQYTRLLVISVKMCIVFIFKSRNKTGSWANAMRTSSPRIIWLVLSEIYKILIILFRWLGKFSLWSPKNKNTLMGVFILLEATLRIELRNGSFADSCLTAWLCRHYK